MIDLIEMLKSVWNACTLEGEALDKWAWDTVDWISDWGGPSCGEKLTRLECRVINFHALCIDYALLRCMSDLGRSDAVWVLMTSDDWYFDNFANLEE